jgi:hypothetical protein
MRENGHMPTQHHVSRILGYEVIGFVAIIALSWINELSDMPRLVGANQYIPNWRESTLETLIVLAVAIPVMILTKRLLSRLHYLEGFLRVCSWCKKLEHGGEWIALEEFFEQKFETMTSHGMCPACVVEMRSTMEKPASA